MKKNNVIISNYVNCQLKTTADEMTVHERKYQS